MKVIKILTLSILIAVFSLGYTAHFFTKSVDFVKCENMAGNKESCHKALSQKEIVKSCDCCADNYLSSYISDQSYIEEIYFAFTQNLFTLRTDELESVYLVSLSRPPKTL